MMNFGKRVRGFFNTRLGFFILALALYWAKTYWAYQAKFNLGVSGMTQNFLLILNPFPTAILLFGIALYLNGRKSYIMMLLVDFLSTLWLFSNILYYREFSDFLTLAVIKGSGAVSNNLSTGITSILKPTDFFVFADILILILLLAFKLIRMDIRPIKKRFALGVSAIASLLFMANLGMANADRSGLLTRSFDNNYLVKYLGLNAYAAVDASKTIKTSAEKGKAKASDLDSVQQFIGQTRAKPNPAYTGVAKGKNIFIIHLESMQQFMIDYKYQGKEVTPVLNRLYHQQDTLSFDNFFNQVGLGKTADAEMMLETSLFGLPQGSAMVTNGGTNTFQAAPAILDQAGYTTASFHGDVPSFWNRDSTYKSWAYDYFFSKAYFSDGKGFDIGYGLKDKIFLKDSAQYIEQLPQPFYAKMITVTNHYPYDLDKDNTTIDRTETGDNTVDGYVQTARYLDEALGEFFSWLQKTGLDKNSMIVLYGDHYGISGAHKDAMGKLLNKEDYNDFDDAQQQRVPFMIHMPGLKGGINHTYGGEIDVLPTLLNLVGISDKPYIQFGSDLLSPKRNQVVAFRNGDFVTPQYTKVGSDVYDTKTGEVLKKMTPAQQTAVDAATNLVTTTLSLSDRVMNRDLLRFYTPKGFEPVDKSAFTYNKEKSLEKLSEDAKKPTSLISKNKGKSQLDKYVTNAPELKAQGEDKAESSSSNK